MFTGTAEDMTRWSELQKISGKTEKELLSEMSKSADNWESILKMQQFYKEYEGKAIIPSHHQMPAKSDIFERYISLCNDILSGKLTGKYEDQGLCDGKVVKGYKLQMVYRKIK